MTALSALGLTPARPRAASLESPLLPLTATSLVEWLTGPKVKAGVSVTEHGSMAMPAVWRAVTLISSVCAALPLHAFKRGTTSREPLTSGATAALLADPHPDMPDFELWELVYGSLLLWGNAYLRKLRNPLGVLAELWWVAPNRVKAGRDPVSGGKVYVIDGDEENPLTDREILHIPFFSVDGVVGLSPVRRHREGIGLALAAEQAAGQLFGNGMMAAGIITSDQRIDDDKAKELKARWKENVGVGIDTAHDIVILGSGSKYQQLTIPPEDAQFLESRKFQVEEIARIFGLPTHMLAHTEPSTSWGTGIEQMTIGLVVYTLQPTYLTRVERRLTKALGPGTEYVRYTVEGLLRGDSAARGEFYWKLFQMGVLSPNDIAALEDRPPLGDDGDRRFVPANLVELGAPAPVPAPAPGPSPPPAPAPPGSDQEEVTVDGGR